jgi:hypothetical protein
MDIYDRDFRDCVAVDARLKNIIRTLDLHDGADLQVFFQQLARESNLETWEVDRLLFGFTDYFIAAVRW